MSKNIGVRKPKQIPRETVEFSALVCQMDRTRALAERIGEPVERLLDIGMARGLTWVEKEYVPAVERERGRQRRVS